MKIELKPCPFCGGEAERIDIAEGDNAGGSCISCTVCQASGNLEFGLKENFVSNWNRRATNDLGSAREIIAGLRHAASNRSDRLQQTHAIDAAIAFLYTVPAALAAQTQQGVEVKDWHRSDNAYGGVMLYSLREDGWRKGAPVMVNDVTIRIERAPGSETDIEPIVQRVLSALVDVPAVESEPVAWLDDGTCRAGSDRTAHRVITDEQKRDMPSAISASFTTPLYAHPPRSLSNEGSEISADLIERCQEVFAWKSTGILPGSRLREQARAIRDRFNGVFDMSEALKQAEEETKREAMRLLLTLSTRKGSSEGDGSSTITKGCAE